MKIEHIALLGAGALLLIRASSKLGNPLEEPHGTVSPTAYRGTDIQQSALGVVFRAVGYGPGWLGIPPSGAGGMRYYGTVQTADISGGHGGAGAR